jgi:septal ring factor EnvC (AmiA/AmiB activator)
MLNETKAGIEKEIKQTRLAINGYLDKLEKELMTKLQEAGDSAKGQIMELVATLAENEKDILECQDNLQNIKTSNKCSISWTELEFFTLSTTSSSRTISLQCLWDAITHFRQHMF